jgi:predicted RNA-binding Zn-ribbon protein involved in translation (DUF1610 family)
VSGSKGGQQKDTIVTKFTEHPPTILKLNRNQATATARKEDVGHLVWVCVRLSNVDLLDLRDESSTVPTLLVGGRASENNVTLEHDTEDGFCQEVLAFSGPVEISRGEAPFVTLMRVAGGEAGQACQVRMILDAERYRALARHLAGSAERGEQESGCIDIGVLEFDAVGYGPVGHEHLVKTSLQSVHINAREILTEAKQMGIEDAWPINEGSAERAGPPASNLAPAILPIAHTDESRSGLHDTQGQQLGQSTSNGDATSAPPLCPQCGSQMIIRSARQGSNNGSQFFGCSRFPDCRGTRPIQSPEPVVARRDTPLCPDCGRAMVIKTARSGHFAGKPFWGCSGYPGCLGILKA